MKGGNMVATFVYATQVNWRRRARRPEVARSRRRNVVSLFEILADAPQAVEPLKELQAIQAIIERCRGYLHQPRS